MSCRRSAPAATVLAQRPPRRQRHARDHEFDASSYPCRVAAPVPPVSIDAAVPLDGDDGSDGPIADPKRDSRAALFGVIAAREAWSDAASAPASRMPALIGTGGGGIDVGEKQYQDFFTPAAGT